MQKLNVIAISKNVNYDNELEVYIYQNGIIYLYSHNKKNIQIEWDYKEKISQIAMGVDEGALDWVDIYIKKGQQITRDDDIILVNGKCVRTFNKLSKKDFAKVGPVTSKIYNEFIRSRAKKNNLLRHFVKEAFDEGFFTKNIADIVEDVYDYSIDENDLNNLDKQIIVRVKIEGYKFIISFIKNILASNSKQANAYCQQFFTRVFMLETQNFIKVNVDKEFTI